MTHRIAFVAAALFALTAWLMCFVGFWLAALSERKWQSRRKRCASDLGESG